MDDVSLPGQQVPGNLLVADGLLICQSPLAVAGYGPPIEDKGAK